MSTRRRCCAPAVHPQLIDYDEMLARLSSILVGKYVILDDYKAFGETLRIELAT